jgi:hypothetical protein
VNNVQQQLLTIDLATRGDVTIASAVPRHVVEQLCVPSIGASAENSEDDFDMLLANLAEAAPTATAEV